MAAISAVRARFDEVVRRSPTVTPRCVVEHADGVTRVVGPGPEWCAVVWSDLEDVDPAPVVAAQLARYAEVGAGWEWKLYSYDRPPDLAAYLEAAGFAAQATETVLVAETATLDLAVEPPRGVSLEAVTDAAGIATLVGVHDSVFGGTHAAIGEALAAGLAQSPQAAAGVVATAGGAPIAAARLELGADGVFASLWGGGVEPPWRGRGVYRALVAWRCALAAARGYAYVQVDALPSSRGALEGMGFVAIAETTPFVYLGS